MWFWCSPSISESFDADHVRRLWESAEDELAAWFGFRLEKPIKLILFATEAELGRAFGDDGRGRAVSGANSVALSVESADVAGSPEHPETIRHELAHVFSAKWDLEALPFKAEGLACWLAGTYDKRPIDFVALVRVVADGCPPLSRLLDRDTWKSRERHGYPIAGSFTGFLISEFGRERYKEFYEKARGEMFEPVLNQVFGQGLLTLERQWMAQLLRRRPEFEPDISAAISESRAYEAYNDWQLFRCIEEIESSDRSGHATVGGLRYAGRACCMIGDYIKAAYCLRRATEIWTEDSPVSREALWLELGQCEDLAGRREAALHAYQQVVGGLRATTEDDGSYRKSAELYVQRPYSVSDWFDELRGWERE